MKVQEWIEKAKAEDMAKDFVVYANIGDNTDELVACTAKEADDAGAEIVDIYFVEQTQFFRIAVITAEVK